MRDLRADGLSLTYDNLVVREPSLDLSAGAITAIVGANACGKSKLLRGMARLLKPRAGAVLLDAEFEIFNMPEGINFERIVALEPDLILGVFSGMSEDDYETLSEIAPTVALATYSNSMWKEEIVPLVGEIYGRPENAEEALGNYEQRIKALRSELGDPEDIIVSSVSVFADSISLSGTISPSSLVLGDIGFARPEPQDFELTEDDLSSLPISEERIPDMNGDVIFVCVTDRQAYENLRENRLWQNLEAVRSGNVHPVTSTAWFFPGLFAANAVLDDIEEALL